MMVNEKSESTSQSITDLLEVFKNASTRKRRSIIQTLEQRCDELAALGPEVMSSFDKGGDDWAPGYILQLFSKYQKTFLYKELLSGANSGWFETPTNKNIDYEPLQKSLLESRFEDADRLTSSLMRQLAGVSAVERGYVYFSEVKTIPKVDLQTIDRLWVAYSQAKFGFSVQAKILDSLGGRYDKLWPRIGWKKDGIWTRYPGSFSWTIDAPEGHMPLINQLRGVRLMDSVLNHPALLERR